MKSVYLTSMATNGLTFLVSRESSKTKLRQFAPLVPAVFADFIY